MRTCDREFGNGVVKGLLARVIMQYIVVILGRHIGYSSQTPRPALGVASSCAKPFVWVDIIPATSE